MLSDDERALLQDYVNDAAIAGSAENIFDKAALAYATMEKKFATPQRRAFYLPFLPGYDDRGPESFPLYQEGEMLYEPAYDLPANLEIQSPGNPSLLDVKAVEFGDADIQAASVESLQAFADSVRRVQVALDDNGNADCELSKDMASHVHDPDIIQDFESLKRGAFVPVSLVERLFKTTNAVSALGQDKFIVAPDVIRNAIADAYPNQTDMPDEERAFVEAYDRIKAFNRKWVQFEENNKLEQVGNVTSRLAQERIDATMQKWRRPDDNSQKTSQGF